MPEWSRHMKGFNVISPQFVFIDLQDHPVHFCHVLYILQLYWLTEEYNILRYVFITNVLIYVNVCSLSQCPFVYLIVLHDKNILTLL